METSLDLPTQRRVTEVLRRLSDPKTAGEMGLYGHRLLDAGASGDPLIYSLTLYERGDGVNYLRVQADNLDQPFDINQGAKLDLGSTAKLRTLITYLEIIAELHARLSGNEPAELKVVAAAADPLTAWAAGYLATHSDRSLAGMLEAAMRRNYSASPWERFFTGGGLHQFANFNPDHNGRTMSVAEAFRHSVNLVFVRLMRDIVRYYVAVHLPFARDLVEDRAHPARAQYLVRFAESEGRAFLNQFYNQLGGLGADGALAQLVKEVRLRPDRLAVIYRSVRPGAERAEFAAFLQTHLPNVSGREADRLYDAYASDRFSLADRAFIARVHPLKLWLVGYLQEHPTTTRAAMLEASAGARQDSYAWLFRTKHKRAQDRRIRILLEEEAFVRIHEAWRRLGYPFDSLVASYATAIGSSADRPEALAELIGIILNDGVWQPPVRVQRLHFAADTPYETVLGLAPAAPRQVLAPEIAARVRTALIDIVEAGTAQRLHGAFVSAGSGAHGGRRQDRHRRQPQEVLRARRPAGARGSGQPHGDRGVLHRRRLLRQPDGLRPRARGRRFRVHELAARAAAARHGARPAAAARSARHPHRLDRDQRRRLISCREAAAAGLTTTPARQSERAGDLGAAGFDSAITSRAASRLAHRAVRSAVGARRSGRLARRSGRGVTSRSHDPILTRDLAGDAAIAAAE